MRGEGHLLGQLQSGRGDFRHARLRRDRELLEQARDDARALLDARRRAVARGGRGRALRRADRRDPRRAMRIVARRPSARAGWWRRAGADTRPTSDRAREALFAMLGDVEGAACSTCFAGSGALGLEALSRGAAACTFVERDRAAPRRAARQRRGARRRRPLHGACAGTSAASLRADAAAGPAVRSAADRPALPYAVRRSPCTRPALLGDLAPAGARLALEAAAGDEPVVLAGSSSIRRRRAGAASLSLFTRTEEPL